MAEPKVYIRRSSVPGKIPTTAQLAAGELAVNTYDGKVYIEQDQGAVGVGTTVIVINPWNVGLGSTSYNTYFTAGNVGVGSTNPTSKLSVDGNVYVSGIITSSSGVLISGVEIATAGGTVGTGVTLLDFRGTGISTVTVSSGIGTINITGGGSATPDISPVMMGMIF